MIRGFSAEYWLRCRIQLLLFFPALVLPAGAQQPAKTAQPAPSADVCAYNSHFYPAKSHQMHGLTCQQCIEGQWVDVGNQECRAQRKNSALKQGNPKGHLCSRDNGTTYSVGAIFVGPDDCSRCTGRASPNDWDVVDRMYFCEKLNPSGDVD